MKDKGLNIRELQEEERQGRNNPSFLGLYMGFNVPLSKFHTDGGTTYQAAMGTVLGVEGAYFFNRNLGFGGRTTFSNIQLIVNDTASPDNTVNFYTFCLGPYFSLPLTLRWTVDTKLLATLTQYNTTKIENNYIQCDTGLGIGTGFSINYRVKKHFGFGLFSDYNIQPAHSQNCRAYVHTLTLGTKAAIRF